LINLFLTEDEALMGYKDTHKNISAKTNMWWSGHSVVGHNPNTSQWCLCCYFLR